MRTTEGCSFEIYFIKGMLGGILIAEAFGQICHVIKTHYTRIRVAAAVVFGGSANGTAEWRVEGSGLVYKRWEELQIEQEMGKAG